MLIDSFEVENFRSLKHLKLEKLARVNLLVGKNNVGKTTVLESIYALSNITSPDWFAALLKARNISLADSNFNQLFSNVSAGESILLNATYKPQEFPYLDGQNIKARMIFTDAVTQNDLNNIDWDLDRDAQKIRYDNTLSILLSTPFVDSPVSYDIAIDGRAMPRFLIRRNSPEASVIIKRLHSDKAYRTSVELVPSQIRLRELSSRIERLKIALADDELVDILRRVDERIERVELGGAGQIYFNLGRTMKSLLPINLMGEGIQHLMIVLSAMIDKKEGIVLIDEVDNGLHYSALRVLWKGILAAARKYDVQVFATTHSAEALRHLTWVLDDEEYKIYREDVAAYTLIRAKDDTVRSFRYNYEQLDFAMEHDMEVRN